ncbi:hypothetical protein [Dickeya chrysanthemi]|uniref:Uncharacterized protein n=2 Tax=Dickeya chrysanthemi TaxID=556 RepID=A0ABU8JKJ0_DICCH|nr:hypothetical protein [Dickeya chrysanthemi]
MEQKYGKQGDDDERVGMNRPVMSYLWVLTGVFLLVAAAGLLR